MTRAMEHPRTTVHTLSAPNGVWGATWASTLRLALVVSSIAAIVAAGLHAVADVSTTAVVLTVIVVAFATSWVRSGRTLS